MINVQDLKESQLDALREAANIGAGHAATALSEMTGRRILVSVPVFQVAPLEQVSDRIVRPAELVAAVLMEVHGELSGHMLLLLPEASARRVAELLLQRPVHEIEHLDELELSALREAGNVVCGAYLNALSEFLGMRLLPSVPGLVVDQARAVLTTLFSELVADGSAFSMETEFRLDGQGRVPGYVLLLPDVESLEAMLRTVRQA